MADHQQDSQPWNAGGLDNLDFQQNDPHPTSSHPPSASHSASASPPDYHIANGTAAPPTTNDPIPSTGPDPTFADLAANPAWADPNQFTPPLDAADGAEPSFDTLNLFPDTWNVPTASFPNQSLQYRPRPEELSQFQAPPPGVDFFNAFVNGSGANLAGDPSRPIPGSLAMSTLTPAQQEQLRNIAMPAHLQYQSPKSEPSQPSPQSSIGDGMKLASPDPSKSGSRKRKSSADEDDLDDEDDEDGQQPVKKTAHNMIEKRYRTNLNDKIAALRDSVPSLRVLSKSARGEDTTEDREELHGLTPAHKLNKATVRLNRRIDVAVVYADVLAGFEQSDRIHQTSRKAQQPIERRKQPNAAEDIGIRKIVYGQCDEWYHESNSECQPCHAIRPGRRAVYEHACRHTKRN